MSITEAERHQLYTRLEEVLGPDEATSLMEHLPPVGWADVATKRDLDHLATQLRGEMHQMSAEIASQMHRQTYSLIGAVATISTLIAVVSRLP